jgi:hypothetical protein
VEVTLGKRAIILFLGLLGLVGLGWLGGRLKWSAGLPQQQAEKPPVQIIKEPALVASRTFDPAAPPPDMPPLHPYEIAVCDSDFVSNANVSGESRREDATHATITITHVNITLDLHVTIWVPREAPQHVVEHEDGHRQISEYYYQSADKIADQIAERYIGKQIEISGSDLNAASSETLQQLAAEITAEYNKELNPGPTQELYDTITDHSRNEMVAKDAAVAAINNAEIAAIRPPAAPAN